MDVNRAQEAYFHDLGIQQVKIPTCVGAIETIRIHLGSVAACSDLGILRRDVVGFLEARVVLHVFVMFVEEVPHKGLCVRE
jgi:hypothetical protein